MTLIVNFLHLEKEETFILLVVILKHTMVFYIKQMHIADIRCILISSMYEKWFMIYHVL